VSWEAGASLVLAVALVGGFVWYERSRPPARVLALVAALAALAVVGRLAFAAFPNVKPTTDIVLFAGFALGAAPGFAVGAVTAIVSNIFLSQGPWTVWQMAAWGGVGIGGAGLARFARGRELGRVKLAIACGLAGLAFGAFMDVYQWTLAARQDLGSYLVISGSSLPYNLAHAFGNVFFCLVIGPAFVRALRRYRRRFEVRWAAPVPARAATTATLALLVLAVGLAAAPVAGASTTSKAVRYLKRAQNRDGGFGGARGQSSNQLHTGWTALGLAAAKVNARDVKRRGGRTVATYIKRHAGSLNDTGELERTLLVLKTAGLSMHRFGGHDLVARLAGRQSANGSWKNNSTLTSFAMLALRASGKPAGAGSIQGGAAYVARSQNGDGGFGYVASTVSDADDTGAALQGLAVAGRGSGPQAKAAVRYLRGIQNGDGGFPQMKGRTSNAQSTAWAVQGLLAVHAGSVNKAIGYLKGLQRRDGAIRYSRSSSQTPVWVTGQALTALRRKPFPIGKVKRKRRKRHHHAAPAAAAARGHKGTRHRKRMHAAAKKQPATAKDPRAQAGTAPRPAKAGPARRTAAHTRDDGVPAWLLAAGAAVALMLVGTLRVWLRRRRAAAAT
jgi:prenyltransferase beta subunit